MSAAIVKALESVCLAGRKTWDVYEDWLDITLATLEAMPRHAESAAKHGKPAEDTPEAQALWAALRTRYSRADFEHFRTAFAALVDAAALRGWDGHGGTWDILGDVYMQLNASSNHSGQYFTPWSVARMMAAMQTEGIDAACRARIAEAIDAGPWGVMGLANGESITQAGKEDIMLIALADAYAHLRPITVCDPACGSGVTLLAFAAACPRWALDYNVVRFFGQDVDRTCVKMARANMMLYGLNGYSIKLNAAIAGAQVATSAAVVIAPPDAPAPAEATITISSARAEQGSLFA